MKPEMPMMDKKPPSDVVELIIAVDLNPKNPEEPINVKDVEVNPVGKGGGDDGDGELKALLVALLRALAGADDRFDGLSMEKLLKAQEDAELDDLISGLLKGGEEKDDYEDEKPDPFSKIMGGKSKATGSPVEDEDEEKDDPFSKMKKGR